MVKTAALVFGFMSGALLSPVARPQAPPPAQTEAAGARLSLLAVTYPEGESVKVQLHGTARLIEASGQAEVKRKPGITEIDAKLEGMKPAISFGGDFNTYVLWTISPEGMAINAGEFVLQGDKSRLQVATPLMTFGLFVTAEPHFLVQQPSGFFVLLNIGEGLEQKKGVSVIPFEYDAIRTGYSFQEANLRASSETEGRLRTDRYQAIVAVRLAEKAEAQKYAPREFARAQAALSATQQAFAQGLDDKQLSLLAHHAVRLAVESRRLAESRAAQQALEAERESYKQTTARLTRAKEEAEAEARRAGEDAKQARLAEQKARSEQKRAEEQMLRANQESDRLARQKLEADKQAEAAEKQTAAMYARLEGALSRVAETRETARGLVVNLPDILFDSGKSTLRSKAKEVLSRIAGVLLVAPEYHLSIEGHTDSVGSARANQRLSEERARAVFDYLAEAHVSPALMTTQGFGETQPVASNNTAAGRQRNRRVEIVVEGLTR